MARPSRYETPWTGAPKGGFIKRINSQRWRARQALSGHTRTFDTEHDAIEWAGNTPLGQTMKEE